MLTNDTGGTFADVPQNGKDNVAKCRRRGQFAIAIEESIEWFMQEKECFEHQQAENKRSSQDIAYA